MTYPRPSNPLRVTASFSRMGPVVAACVVLLFSASTHGVQPKQWTHTTEADFADGETDNTVVTNLGDVKLAQATSVVAELPGQVNAVYDIQVTANGDTYLAVGPESAIIRLREGEKPEQVAALPGESVFALDLTTEGDLLVAISATDSRIAVLRDGQLETLQILPGVRYLWDTIADGRRVYLATGTEGKLLMVDLDKPKDADDAIVELLDTAQTNLLCLGRDARGRVYAGTDTDGLVYRVDATRLDKPNVFVLYDAPEPEIGAIVVALDGTVYVGTADANQATPGRLEDAADADPGRPELPTEEPGDDPQVPADIPQVPPEPAPIDGLPDGAASSNEPTSEPQVGQDSPGDPNAEPAPDAQAALGRPHRSLTIDAPRDARSLAAASQPQQPAEPTAEQRDRLREVIRKRLLAARGSAKPDSLRNGLGNMSRAKTRSVRAGGGGGGSSSSSTEGNAVYRISPDGFVTEMFRDSVMIHHLLADPADPTKLLVATGSEGQLFRINPDADETVMLTQLDAEQIPIMAARPDGQVLLGTANPAMLLRLEPGYTDQGTYTSKVLDAEHISLWGKLNVTGFTPEGTAIKVQTRSGNVEDPDVAAWSDWSPPQVFKHQPDGDSAAPRVTTVDSPPARFLQYRLQLESTAAATPAIDRVQLAYVVPNLKPAVTSISVTHPSDGDSGDNDDDSDDNEPTTAMDIEWEATDPNGDGLRYTLEYQPVGSAKWLLIEDGIDDESYEWQTRHVPDGRYQIRVTADDSPDNPADMAERAVRRSSPVLVDNTPPTLDPLTHEVAAGPIITIAAQAQDTFSAIRAVSYTVDSPDDWQTVLPDDLIFDSTAEAFSITITGLAPGPHVVTIRVTDRRGNARYEALLIDTE